MASSGVSALTLGHRLVGQATPPRTTVVDESRIAAFAAATGDERGVADAGRVAPAMFSVVPVMASITDAVELMTGSRAVPATMLHMGHDLRIERPIRPRQELQARTVVRAIQARPSGVVVQLDLETAASDGPLLNRQTMVLFFRGASGPDSAGEPASPYAGPARPDGSVETVTEIIDNDMTARYALASGDTNPIHLDDEAARAAGLPGRILHGLCTMAICTRGVAAVCADGQTSRLLRVAARFVRPVLPGDGLTTAVWRGSGGAAWFEARAGDETVVDHGLASMSVGGKLSRARSRK